MREDPMSPRQQVASNLADTCIFGDLNDATGVSLCKSLDKNQKEHWSVTFCKGAKLSGTIRVYGPNFILMVWESSGKDYPASNNKVFRTEFMAKEFIVRNFINR